MARSRRKSAVHEPEYQYMIRRLREAREAAGLTQEAVAEALGRPLSFVSKCELGERRIDPLDLKRFSRLYGQEDLDFFYPEPLRSRKPKGKRAPDVK